MSFALRLSRRTGVSVIKVTGEAIISIGNMPTHLVRKNDLLDPQGIESDSTAKTSFFVANCPW